ERAYRRLARMYHPDRNNSSHVESMIKKINAAFEILSDDDKKRKYDKTDFETDITLAQLLISYMRKGCPTDQNSF
ncbi:MAG: DnaJ domain-containing protein, partial [Candidatus Nitrosopolaris sp.]